MSVGLFDIKGVNRDYRNFIKNNSKISFSKMEKERSFWY